MSTTTSHVELLPARAHPPLRQAVAALEVLAVFAGILLYIWRLQYSHPYLWIPFLAAVMLSHFAHRDTLRGLGLGAHELGPCARTIFPLAVAVLLPALLYGLARGIILPALPGFRAIHYFSNYLIWCIFQQYLAQSFFHNRLMSVVENRYVSSSLVALMFAAAHLPNPALMAVTALGGFVLAEVFSRHRNLWPLALVQAVAGALVAALVPAPILHNMRVGPGYFFYKQP
jgi:Type II CAAX prenyl endopeptidase Rce1-like